MNSLINDKLAPIIQKARPSLAEALKNAPATGGWVGDSALNQTMPCLGGIDKPPSVFSNRHNSMPFKPERTRNNDVFNTSGQVEMQETGSTAFRNFNRTR